MKFKKGWQPVSMEGFLKACPICKNDGSDLCFECKAEIGKSGFEPKGGVEPTNADRIRAMSDEELVNIVPCPLGFSMFRCTKNQKCKDCKKEWLKQLAEVEE